MNKVVCIRVDGSAEIGTGHIFRCLALAEELYYKGFKPVFCTKDFDSELIEKIKSMGFELSIIPANLSLEEDMKLFANIGKNNNADIVITDNYYFIDGYLKHLKDNFKVVVSIDDIADTFFYSDILINQNINAIPEKYYGKTENGTKLLLGPTYALLRKEFKKYHNKPRKFGKVENILVTLGGSDKENQTLKVLKALEKVEGEFSITIVLGVSNRNKESIREYVNKAKKDIKLHENVSSMAELIYEADISIGAGGSTSWEFCCIGVPIIIIFLAENQKEIAEGLCARGISVNLGWYKHVSENDIKVAVEDLINNPYKRGVMSQKGREIVDGKGAERVTEEIISLLREEYEGENN